MACRPPSGSPRCRTCRPRRRSASTTLMSIWAGIFAPKGTPRAGGGASSPTRSTRRSTTRRAAAHQHSRRLDPGQGGADAGGVRRLCEGRDRALGAGAEGGGRAGEVALRPNSRTAGNFVVPGAGPALRERGRACGRRGSSKEQSRVCERLRALAEREHPARRRPAPPVARQRSAHMLQKLRRDSAMTEMRAANRREQRVLTDTVQPQRDGARPAARRGSTTTPVTI